MTPGSPRSPGPPPRASSATSSTCSRTGARTRGDDVVSALVRAEIDGVPFADEHLTPASEMLGLMMVLFLGGVESTAGLTGPLFKLLAENPDQRELLRRDPSLIPDAVEETSATRVRCSWSAGPPPERSPCTG